MCFARRPLSSVSPLYILTIGQSENTPGPKTCHRNPCTTEPMITATQSEGYKVKKWSGGVICEEQEPSQIHSRIIWNMFGDYLGDTTIQKVTYLSSIQCHIQLPHVQTCGQMNSAPKLPEAGRQGQRKRKRERGLNGMRRKMQSYQVCST